MSKYVLLSRRTGGGRATEDLLTHRKYRAGRPQQQQKHTTAKRDQGEEIGGRILGGKQGGEDGRKTIMIKRLSNEALFD